MKEFEFTLRFDVSRLAAEPEALVERLGEQGCTDATVGTGLAGRLALAFVREADSAPAAVLSALRDVLAALPGAELIEASPDFVEISDIAALVGRRRQSIYKLLSTCADGPAPVHEGSASVWRLAPVLHWLRDEKRYSIDRELLELADATMQVNLAASTPRAEPFAHEVEDVLGASVCRETGGGSAPHGIVN